MSVLELIGRTPMVRLERIHPRVYAKCEHLNPGGSVKDRLALAIVQAAEEQGLLTQGSTLVEATAGNTGLGLALLAAVRGYRLVCVLPEKMSEDKRVALRAAGARVVVTPNAPLDSPDNFRNVAARLAREKGWFLTDQFAHPANPRIHEQTTGPEVLEQVPEVAAFVAGAGTGGTLTGVGRFFRRARPSVRMVLADPVGSGLAHWLETGVPGPDGAYQLEGIGSAQPPPNLDRDSLDEVEVVLDQESFAMARRLIREEGLLVGGSSGTAVAAALRVAERVDGPVVALLADSWDRYLSRSWLVEGD